MKARLRPGAHQRLAAAVHRHRGRSRCARRGAPGQRRPPVLLSVGMMRTRDKLASYRVLAEALALLQRQALAGAAGRRRAGARRGRGADGAARRAGVRFAGAVPHAELPAIYAAADLYLWPAINEAYGMAFLEAQAAGLPVVAGRTGGVPAVVADGVTGLLTPIGDAAAFAAAVGAPARRPDRARAAGRRRRARASPRHHDERAAARALAAALDGRCDERARSPSCATPPPTGTPSAACRA